VNDLEPDENSQTKISARTSERTSGRLARAGTVLLVGGVVVAVGLGGLYLNRRAVADHVLVGWLEKRDIEADVEVDRFDWNGFTGRLTVGDPDDPDVRIDRVDVDYSIGMPWSRYGMGVLPSRVVLSRPLVKASWIDRKLSLGSLDPLIEEFTSKPPGPKKPGPLIVVEKGEARITTDYGQISLLADARINDGRLQYVQARLPQAALRHATVNADDLTATFEAREAAGRLDFKAQVSARTLTGADVAAEQLEVSLAGAVPYPQNGENTALGEVSLTGDLAAGSLTSPSANVGDLQGQFDWSGQFEGWIDRFTLNGKAETRLAAASLETAGNRVQRAVWSAPALDIKLERAQNPNREGLSWRIEGAHSLLARSGQIAGFNGRDVRIESSGLVLGGYADRFEGRGPLRLQMASVEGHDLRLKQLDSRLMLDAVRDAATRVSIYGSLNGAGAYSGLGAVGAADAPEMASLKTALSDFRLDVPMVRLTSDDRGTEVVLPQQAVVRSRSGAAITLEASRQPLFETGRGTTGGVARLKASGGGIPQLDLDIPRWRLVAEGLEADLAAQAKLDFTPVKGAEITTRGRLSIRDGRTRYVASECAAVSAAEFMLGENDIRDISGRLCGDQGGLFEMANGRWRLGGQLQQTQLAADFLQMVLGDGSGALSVTGDKAGLKVDLSVDRSRIYDLSQVARFEPMQGRGAIRLASDIWTGAFDVGLPDQPVGQLCLRHEARSGQGGLAITTVGMPCTAPMAFGEAVPEPQGGLVFAEHGLQPKALSALVPDAIGEPVSGRAAFAGHMVWGGDRLESAGRIALRDFSFASPVGKVSGGTGDIRIDSLVPLVVPAGQTLRFDRIDGPLPMTDLNLAFGFEGQSLYVQKASVDLAEGEAFLFDSRGYNATEGLPPTEEIAGKGLEIPVGASTAWQFGVGIRGLQLNSLMQAVGVGERASLDAEVTGVLPVTFHPEWGFAISNGVLVADRRGSLSIAPEVLGHLDAGGGQVATSEGEQAEVPRNMMQDLAYQALEHLTFTNLRADVNSICLPQNEAERSGADAGMGQPCHNLGPGQTGWIPSRLALDFAINGYYDPPERKEMRLSLLDVLRGNFMSKKMILPSDTPVTLGLKTSINAYDLASQIMDYVRSRNDAAVDTPDSPQ